MTRSMATREPTGVESTTHTPDILKRAKHLLGLGQVAAARAILQRALREHPTDHTLRNLLQVISPGRVESKKVKYQDRTRELNWIAKNKAKYPEQWVALVGDSAIGIEATLTALLDVIQKQVPQEMPLIHHLD